MSGLRRHRERYHSGCPEKLRGVKNERDSEHPLQGGCGRYSPALYSGTFGGRCGRRHSVLTGGSGDAAKRLRVPRLVSLGTGRLGLLMTLGPCPFSRRARTPARPVTVCSSCRTATVRKCGPPLRRRQTSERQCFPVVSPPAGTGQLSAAAVPQPLLPISMATVFRRASQVTTTTSSRTACTAHDNRVFCFHQISMLPGCTPFFLSS